MLSQSRFQQATTQFMNTLSEISNQINAYYFQYRTPTQPYKMKRHLTELYNFVYDGCTQKPAKQDKMLQVYKLALQKHLVKEMGFLQRCNKQENVIQIYNLIWESYTSYTLLLSNRIFAYLNRYYIPANGHESLNRISLKIFLGSALTQNLLKIYVPQYITQLQKMRTTKIINNCELLKFSQTFAIIDNTTLFSLMKDVYILQTTKHYKSIFEKHCNDEPMTYFNILINQRYFQSMLVRKSICFTESETLSLQQIFNDQLIKRYTHIFCHQPYGFSYLLRKHKTNDLKLICQVYQKLQGFQELKKFLYQFMIEQGKIVLTQKSKSASSEQFINCFYQLYTDYLKLITESFPKVSQMHASFKSSIQKLSTKYDRITQDLFKVTRHYLDLGKFDLVADKIIMIFQKLPYKDQFINLYRSSLEKKIIHGPLIYWIEKNFILKLNQICGNDATADLNKILQDCVSCQLENLSLKSEYSQNLNIKVVSHHFWQKKFQDQLTLNLTLIQPLSSTWSKFQQKYTMLFSKRRLMLLPYQTKMILKIYSKNKQITMKCNLIQSCIILFIANRGQKKIRQEHVITNLTLQKTFLHRFLEEYPNLITQDQNGFYNFNWNFQTVDSFIDLDSKVEEEKKVTKHVKQDREILVQCAIAKIMKRAKQLEFQDLVHQVCQQIRLFKPLPSNIKTGIESLKKKQIIQESEDGRILYMV